MSRDGKKSGGRDFRPGQSGNPGGGKTIPGSVQEVRKLTVAKFITAANKYLHLSVSELVVIAEDTSLTALDSAVARFLLKCARDGNYPALNHLLERLIGKVSDKIEHSTAKNTVVKLIGEQAAVVIGRAKQEEEE